MRPRQMATWMLAITCAALPTYYYRFHIGPLPTTLLEVLILLTFAAYAATLWTERRVTLVRTWLDVPIAVLLIAGVIGIVFAPDHTRAVGIYRAYFVEPVVLYYVALDLIRTKDDLRLLLLVAAVGASLFAVGQLGRFAIAAAHHSIEIDNGPAFLNSSANAVAMYLEPPLAFSVAFVVYASSARERLVALACCALMLIGVFLTLSRAGYLAMAVFAVLVVVTLPNPRWRVGAVAGLAVATLIAVELPIFSERIGTFAHSVQLRTSIYQQALKMLGQRPVTGAGISGFPVRVAPFRPASQEIELYPHNLWLTTWSELGLLGLIAFAVIFFGLLWGAARAIRRSAGVYRAVLWGSIGTLVLYLVHGMFDSPYWKNDLSAEFWLVAALTMIAVRGADQFLRSGAPDQRRPSSESPTT